MSDTVEKLKFKDRDKVRYSTAWCQSTGAHHSSKVWREVGVIVGFQHVWAKVDFGGGDIRLVCPENLQRHNAPGLGVDAKGYTGHPVTGARCNKRWGYAL